METCSHKGSRCAVCGAESERHAGWFLVVENTWLDRIKVLSWHPLLAEQDSMRSVCGKPHLEALITHWLMYANLQFAAAHTPEFALPARNNGNEAEEPVRAGQLIGELAVHRESLSRLWTGSAEARESIFQALIAGLEARPSRRATVREQCDEASPQVGTAITQFPNSVFEEYAVQ